MQNWFGLPGDTGTSDVQIFTLASTVTNTQWQTWTKPRGKTMCYILCIGGGAGGGAGFQAASGNARAGGGSGGSSGQTRVLIPLFLLPDRLYVDVGAGGQGVMSGTGGSGVLSYVSVVPYGSSAVNIVAISGAAGAVGGTSGTGAAVGTGGAAGTLAVIGSMALAGLGTFNLIAGQIGVNGGAQTGAIGQAQSIVTTSCVCMAGAGGAGCQSGDFAGGVITAITNNYISDSRPAGAAAGAFNGSAGYTLWKPFFNYGGLGGSASNTGIGGRGGNGAYGAGGGGGGGGIVDAVGGRGGDGGNGIVIIMCW